MLKKIGMIIVVILLVAIVGLGLLVFRLTNMANKIEDELAKAAKVDLNKIADGIYSGSYGDFVVSASVKVAVKSHRIEKITITDQKCGPGYEAADTISRILKSQSPKVDVVTGASSSSRTIMVAVYRALKQGIK